jgi:hypothetical protein
VTSCEKTLYWAPIGKQRLRNIWLQLLNKPYYVTLQQLSLINNCVVLCQISIEKFAVCAAGGHRVGKNKILGQKFGDNLIFAPFFAPFFRALFCTAFPVFLSCPFFLFYVKQPRFVLFVNFFLWKENVDRFWIKFTGMTFNSINCLIYMSCITEKQGNL